MTPDLNQLREAAERATPGPWATDYHFGEASMVIADDVGRMPLATTALYPLAQNKPQVVEANAAFIALANPATVLSLLDRLAAAEAENEKLRLTICGGEDAPGYVASLPLDTILKVHADNAATARRDSELAWDGETATPWKARATTAEVQFAEAMEVLEPFTLPASLLERVRQIDRAAALHTRLTAKDE